MEDEDPWGSLIAVIEPQERLEVTIGSTARPELLHPTAASGKRGEEVTANFSSQAHVT